ncbi:hypothetical protein [Microbulbifer rhizosphaerae]|uniref:Uncharacterized protein n=1 Tax=Microbulbifer rhizosphaerae TaxID=1562603 RepID=A0A7W4WEF9_9GAMM|nr:hypothetical protein [Microbulbifer rhizosphaerae]MBB3062227.1 hypothetical protein [Microbulbifer rhizosphaerae]
MSGQQMFQIVSAGKTLRAKSPAQVLQDAAAAFSVPVPQARRLLLKGWVIKDQLSSKQVLEYRARLQQVGLRVEVHPAGKFDNRALLAKLQFAEKRREQPSKTDTDNRTERKERNAQVARLPTTVAEAKPTTAANSKARTQLESLFGDLPAAPGESSADRAQLILGVLLAALVPGIFVLFAALCIYSAARALWQIPQAMIAGEFSAFVLLGSLLSLGLIAALAALLLWPFFTAGRFAAEFEVASLPLSRDGAPGLHLLLRVLAEKTGLPQVSQLSVSAGAEVMAEPTPEDIKAQQLPLRLGLGAVCTLSGNELLAMVARALGGYKGKLRGTTAWLVRDIARRLQWTQWALENERSAVSPGGQVAPPLKPLHRVLTLGGRAAIPLVDKLLDLHRSLTGPTARLLERQGDAWAAQIIGSEAFAPFADKWHQLVHAELVVAEVNREASLAGQRLANYPDAIAWTLRNLDRETRSNIELAMAQASDSWDWTQAADNERIAWAEELSLAPLVQQDFSVQKLFTDFGALCSSASAAVAAKDSQAVDNIRLLCASKESEQAQQVLAEYFNQLPPRRFLPLELPANGELQAMDLQQAIDWLRGKLVELREQERRLDDLQLREAAMQLGAALVRAQVKIEPEAFFLSGATPAVADESLRDNRSRREELERQRREIFSVFYLRITRTLESMPAAEQRDRQSRLEQLSAYRPLAARLEKLDAYGDIFGLMIDRLSLDGSQRELLQKFYALAAGELRALCEAAGNTAVLRESGMPQMLEERIGSSQVPELPADRQRLRDTLQAMELKCKNASAAVCEHYRIQLAQLLQPCLERERALKVRPLRLVRM